MYGQEPQWPLVKDDMSLHPAPVPATKASRYRMIAEALAAEIRSGSYSIGSQLPVEHDLAARFASSRQTVREALRLLVEQGLIIRRAGSGTTVINTASRAVLALSLGNLSQLLSYPDTVRRRHLSSGHVVADKATSELLACEPGTPWFRIRALRFEADETQPFCWVDLHLLPRFAAVATSRSAESEPIVEQIERRFGERVQSAEIDISVSRVPAESADALQVRPGSPALRVVRRYLSSGGEPFEITVSIHPEGRYTYRTRLKTSKR